MTKIRKHKDIYGRPLPVATDEIIERYLDLLGFSLEKEAPVKEPKTAPVEIPSSPPAPDKSSPWHVPGPKINPKPKAFRRLINLEDINLN